MSSPIEQEYWPALLEQLETRTVAELSEQYGATPAEIDAALAQTTGDRPVQQEAWWPEVLRNHEHGSLRQLARRFGTNPRRLRRGLARCAVRVGGTTIDDAGVAALEPFRDRLGKEPDRTLATESGVTLEAIKGERRRLGIEPYRMKPDVEEWGSKPPGKREKPRQRRRWQDAPEPVIIRRAGHGMDPQEEPAEEDTAVVRVVERRSPAPLPGPPAGEVADKPEEPAPKPRPRASGMSSFGAHAALGLGSNHDDTDDDDPSDKRRRRRIVRPTTPSEGTSPIEGLSRLPRLGSKPPVRIIQPEDADLAELEPARKAEPAASHRVGDVGQAEKPAAKKPAAEKPAAEKPAAKKPAAKKPAAKKPAAKKPAAKKPAAKKPAAKKPAAKKPAAKKPAAKKPAAKKPSPEPVALMEEDLPPLADSPVEPDSAASAGSIAWQVAIPGQADAVLVLAATKSSALEQASKLMKGAPVAGAVATRLGEVLDEGRGD
jgi:hypothetical protein